MSKLSSMLHATFIQATHEIRHRFGQADIGHFDFSMSASGRTMTDQDEVKIEYKVYAGYDCLVKGNDLDKVIVEVMRRKGWDEANAPLALPNVVAAAAK
jgi:hypothetical protein